MLTSLFFYRSKLRKHDELDSTRPSFQQYRRCNNIYYARNTETDLFPSQLQGLSYPYLLYAKLCHSSY